MPGTVTPAAHTVSAARDSSVPSGEGEHAAVDAQARATRALAESGVGRSRNSSVFIVPSSAGRAVRLRAKDAAREFRQNSHSRDAALHVEPGAAYGQMSPTKSEHGRAHAETVCP